MDAFYKHYCDNLSSDTPPVQLPTPVITEAAPSKDFTDDINNLNDITQFHADKLANLENLLERVANLESLTENQALQI